MIRDPLWRSLPVLSCFWLVSAATPTQAQLSISIDDAGVSLQNGNQAPLVVGPGQSFGGTLTPNGFQGVMSDGRGVRPMQPALKNPFRDAKSAAPAGSKPLQINAGGISVSLPGAAPAMVRSEPLTAHQLAAMKQMLRTAEPAKALAEIDRMLARAPQNADLLQMKAVVLMQMSRMRDAAACAYEAMAAGPNWSWPMLRSCFSSKDAVERIYRMLQTELQDHPTPDRLFLLAWWERMLGHDREAVAALERTMEALPSDLLLARMYEDWSATTDAEIPPAALP